MPALCVCFETIDPCARVLTNAMGVGEGTAETLQWGCFPDLQSLS